MNAFDWLDNQLIIQSKQFAPLCSDFGIEEVCLTIPMRVRIHPPIPRSVGLSISLRFGFSHKTAGRMLTCSVHLQNEGKTHWKQNGVKMDNDHTWKQTFLLGSCGLRVMSDWYNSEAMKACKYGFALFYPWGSVPGARSTQGTRSFLLSQVLRSSGCVVSYRG